MNTRKRRCYHDHAHDVLSIATDPVEMTELFWRAKISGNLYKQIRTELFDAGLLELQTRKLHTTEKGQKWLRIYKSLKKLMEAETC